MLDEVKIRAEGSLVLLDFIHAALTGWAIQITTVYLYSLQCYVSSKQFMHFL